MTDKKIQCLIVDDEQLGRELLTTHLKQLKDFHLVASCASAIEASTVLNQQHIDLMFLDIEMPVLNGTDFYHNLSKRPKAIFTTAYREYAVDGFELEAIDYLLKPITFARFFKACERFRRQQTPQPVPQADHLYIRVNRKQIKIKLNDILYIQGLKDYLQIHTHKHTLVTKDTMKSFIKTLTTRFIQVHRSYIVNKSHISAYTKNDIEIGDIEIPIGETFQSRVKKLIL